MTKTDLKELRKAQEVERLTTVVTKRDAKTERIKKRIETLKENENDTD